MNNIYFLPDCMKSQPYKKERLKDRSHIKLNINKFIKNHSTEKSKPNGAVLKY